MFEANNATDTLRLVDRSQKAESAVLEGVP